jgi:Bacterial protein of unknown function (DUF899)
MSAGMHLPEVVSPEEWLAARRELLAKEKELTRMRDRVAPVLLHFRTESELAEAGTPWTESMRGAK